jgi:hypothetical protein
MKDELISFDIAKLAKEKGFDIECFSWWGFFEETKRTELNTENLDLMNHNDWSDLDSEELQEMKIYSAPTKSLLQRWLREKHNIVVDVFQDSKNCSYTGFWKVDISVLGKYQEDEMPTTRILKRDFEETLEAGLQEALKLIKNE